MALNQRIVDWHGKVAWLVGASTGIGRAVAEKLHASGARVVVSARNAAALDAIAAAHPGTIALPLDVADRDRVRDAAARIAADAGSIDFALYCAGTYQPLRATAFDLDTMLDHQRINVTGALHFLDALLPPMLERARAGRPAHVSLVASVAGYRGLPNALAYGPTKAALINLAEVLYLDLSREGVGVSVVNPGFVETPLTAGNTFAMPALITPAEAADAMLRGWARGEFEIHFPKRFTRTLKALRYLSDGLYFAAIRRATRL